MFQIWSKHALADASNCAPPSFRLQCPLLFVYSLSRPLPAPRNSGLNSSSHIDRSGMDACRPGAKHEGGLSSSAETEVSTGPSSAAAVSTEGQLVVLLAASRREAAALRDELAAVRKKADADNRRLESLLQSSSNPIRPKSPDVQIRAYQERLAHAEAALDEAVTRSRIVESNWLQVDRYLAAIQRQAADSRTAFSRIIAQNDGQLVLPDQSLPVLRREIPLRDYISSGGSGEHAPSSSHLPPRESPYSPRATIRPPPLLTPRAAPSRSPPDTRRVEPWDDDGDDAESPPPFKRLRPSGRLHELERAYRSRSPRGASPPVRRRPPVAPLLPRPRDPDRARHPSREYMPPPLSPPRARTQGPRLPDPYAHLPPPLPLRDAQIAREYDARNPPLQIIQHAHPPPPPPPPAPPPAADALHQYQHRFHLGAGAYLPRRLMRPGAYETVVFALDSGAQAYGGRPEGQGQ
ncbi:hypothetical protein B0H15DRAFT_436110 [Mycena belliarum]|uniref:Uncharacterized protein n=1 Tax=Mycena belliarum TaxID=1033014 RepID=A0AAD6U1C9_9AGAR|nr:hypothetical protein B0H15DRAFT_436110 [Mycena belliae]